MYRGIAFGAVGFSFGMPTLLSAAVDLIPETCRLQFTHTTVHTLNTPLHCHYNNSDDSVKNIQEPFILSQCLLLGQSHELTLEVVVFKDT